jgi:hypothetical protein
VGRVIQRGSGFAKPENLLNIQPSEAIWPSIFISLSSLKASPIENLNF